MAAAAAWRLLSRRASTSSFSAFAPAAAAATEQQLLRPAAVAAYRLSFPRGMARRPGGGGGDRAPTEMAPVFPGCDYEHWNGAQISRAELFVNGEIVQRSPERQRRPQRAADRPTLLLRQSRMFRAIPSTACSATKCCRHLGFPPKNVAFSTQKMLRPALACCKLYVSEARSASALRAIERAAVGLRPAVGLINAFADDAYNRVGYTLVSCLSGGTGGSDSPLPPLHRAAFGVVAAALEAVDLGTHAGAHPRLGVVDHIAFHPLAGAQLEDVAALAKAVAADIGDKLQVPTYLYGAAHGEGRTLATIRRQLGYFTPNSPGEQWCGAPEASSLPVAPDTGPGTPWMSKGVVVVGATTWVDNYNVPVHTADVGAAKRIARAVSERGGGLRSVQAMGLVHGEGVSEVACNLLDPGRVSAEQVQERVRQLAAAQGLAVGKGYYTDFSQEKIVELYYQQSAEADASQQ